MFEADGGGNHGQVEIPHGYLESVPFLLPVKSLCSLRAVSPSWPKQLAALISKGQGWLPCQWMAPCPFFCVPLSPPHDGPMGMAVFHRRLGPSWG